MIQAHRLVSAIVLLECMYISARPGSAEVRATAPRCAGDVEVLPLYGQTGTFDLCVSPGILTDVYFPATITSVGGDYQQHLAFEKQGKRLRMMPIPQAGRQPGEVITNLQIDTEDNSHVSLFLRMAESKRTATPIAEVVPESEMALITAELDKRDRERRFFLLKKLAKRRDRVQIRGKVHNQDGDIVIGFQEGIVVGENELYLFFDAENRGHQPYPLADLQVFAKNAPGNLVNMYYVDGLPEGSLTMLPAGQRAQGVVQLPFQQSIAQTLSMTLQGAGLPPVVATVDVIRLVPKTDEELEREEREEAERRREREARGWISLQVQALGGFIWLGDGMGLDRTEPTTMTGLGVRATYSISSLLAVEAEAMGASTGEASFENVAYDGMQGELVRSATLGRVQFGGVLRLGRTYQPFLRLGVGVQGTSLDAALMVNDNPVPGPDSSFELKGLWYVGTGVDIRLGRHFLTGIGLLFNQLQSDTQSLQAGGHLGVAWK